MNYELRIKKSRMHGYTIVETMIAVSLFIVIVMIGMGTLLNANLVHNKSQNMRSIMDNLSFIMEDMSRNLRTGDTYDCFSGPLPISPIATNGSDCGGIAFRFKDSSDVTSTWIYYIDLNSSNNYGIFRKIGNGSVIQMTPDEIDINDTNSSFTVIGAEPPSAGDTLQPFVTIKLVGSITYKGVVSPFSLQTSVSQRRLDI